MFRPRIISVALVCLAAVWARRIDLGGCGTSRETPVERQFFHRQALRQRARAAPLALSAQAATTGDRDIGNVAIIEDTNGVVSSLDPFNLGGMTLAFAPSSSAATDYQYSLAVQVYDSAAASGGSPLVALDDDDSRLISLPFAFPFFGVPYNSLYVNSDGNLTFNAGDSASTDRSLGRMTAGPPRISPLFTDLNPAQTAGGVRVYSDSNHVVVSWIAVPEYSATGGGIPETFQATLYPSGRIAFSYSSIDPNVTAVVGISPGNLAGVTTLVDYRTEATGDYSATVAEWFATGPSIDIVTVAQRFYQTHDDAYDYLVIYNNENIAAYNDALAYETTVRTTGTGYGVAPFDSGQLYGSTSRLKSVLNMGPLNQYPVDPTQEAVFGRPGDSALSILSHESGHLFLAFASIQDPQNSASSPMLGYQNAHWSFLYDSEASFLEGEQILDGGHNAQPYEFITASTVSRYSLLDQYLMGFRPPADVLDTFVVQNPNPAYSALGHPPASPVGFNGGRLNVQIGSLTQTMGRRTPDSTVAQRRFRFAFILVVPQGSSPSLNQLNNLQAQFPLYYAAAADSNASADITLARGMKLSLYPAAGIVTGTQAMATLTLSAAPPSDLTVTLQAPNGHATVPASIVIPAGTATYSFPVNGISTGVEEITATPSGAYETAYARVQVAAASTLKLAVVSGDNQPSPSGGALAKPIVVQVTDINNLPYIGAPLTATASGDGSVSPASVATDSLGQAAFAWTPGSAGVSQLTLALTGAPSVNVKVLAGPKAASITSVVNAASGESGGVAAGSLVSIQGLNLAGGVTQGLAAQGAWPFSLGGVSVSLAGVQLPLYYVSDAGVSLYVPPSVPVGAATLSLTSSTTDTAAVSVVAAQPAIFPGAILLAGTSVNATTTAVHAGDYIEIYCTGLGPLATYGNLQWTVTTPQVFVGPVSAPVIFSGRAPGFLGLNQVDVQVPAGLAAGAQPVTILLGGLHSNSVSILVQ